MLKKCPLLYTDRIDTGIASTYSYYFMQFLSLAKVLVLVKKCYSSSIEYRLPHNQKSQSLRSSDRAGAAMRYSQNEKLGIRGVGLAKH